MALTILIGGIALFAIAAGIFLLLPAPHDSHFRSYKPLPGQSPIDKLLSDGSSNKEIQLPEIFNQAEVVKKLYMLQNSPSIFDKYVLLVWNKFSTATERQLLLQSVKSFQTGQKLLEANTEFQRAMNEFNRLSLEDKIKRKEVDLRLTQLETDIADVKLRKATIKNERNKLKQPQVVPPPLDPADSDDSVFGEKQRKLDDLQKKKKTQEQKINNDTNLSDQERKERLAFLETTYQQEKMKLQVGFGGFEDD